MADIPVQKLKKKSYKELYERLNTDISDIPRDIINLIPKAKTEIGVFYYAVSSGMKASICYEFDLDITTMRDYAEGYERKLGINEFDELVYAGNARQKEDTFLAHAFFAKDAFDRSFPWQIAFKLPKEKIDYLLSYIRKNPDKAKKIFYSVPIKLNLEKRIEELSQESPENVLNNSRQVFDIIIAMAALWKLNNWNYSGKVHIAEF